MSISLRGLKADNETRTHVIHSRQECAIPLGDTRIIFFCFFFHFLYLDHHMLELNYGNLDKVISDSLVLSLCYHHRYDLLEQLKDHFVHFFQTIHITHIFHVLF